MPKGKLDLGPPRPTTKLKRTDKVKRGSSSNRFPALKSKRAAK
jgi:hypothetical protein